MQTAPTRAASPSRPIGMDRLVTLGRVGDAFHALVLALAPIALLVGAVKIVVRRRGAHAPVTGNSEG